MNNGDLPASPMNSISSARAEEGFFDEFAYGLTKREAFAMAALQGSLASDITDGSDVETIAEWAVEAADALLKKLEEE